MKYRVHLVGLHKGTPIVTKEFDMASAEKLGWLLCWNHGKEPAPNVPHPGAMKYARKDERWYPSQGVVSVEVVSEDAPKPVCGARYPAPDKPQEACTLLPGHEEQHDWPSWVPGGVVEVAP